MIKIFILNIVIGTFSATNIQNLNLNTYRKILKDVKQSYAYKSFTKNHHKNCKGITVSPYLFSVYTMGSSFYNDEIIRSYSSQNCSDKKIVFKAKKFKELALLSDKGKTCFVAFFSFKIKNRILIQIKEEDQLYGGESLILVYEIKDGQVKRLESRVIIND